MFYVLVLGERLLSFKMFMNLYFLTFMRWNVVALILWKKQVIGFNITVWVYFEKVKLP